jgi:hypothetical protein
VVVDAVAPVHDTRARRPSAPAWLLLSGRDSELIGSLVAALLALQKTAEPGDELLRFVA